MGCARAAARRQRLDGIQGNPSLRFGYNPWQHHAPDMGREEEDVQSGETCIRGQKKARAMEGVRGKNGSQKFLQAKVRWRSGMQGISGSRRLLGDRSPCRARNKFPENISMGTQGA